MITRDYDQSFDRWTDALMAAKSLIPACKSWFQDIRILAGDELVWVYSRSHTHPQYIGAGTYRRLALLFLQEAAEEAEAVEESSPPSEVENQ